MADPKLIAEDDIQKLVGYRSELNRIHDVYRNMVKNNDRLGRELDDILAQSRSMNKIINNINEVEGKLGSEYVKREKALRIQQQVQTKLLEVETLRANTLAKNQAEYNSILKQIEQREKSIADYNKLGDDLRKKGKLSTEDELSLLKFMEVEVKAISKLTENRAYIQVKAVEDTYKEWLKVKDVTKDIVKNTEASNTSFRRANLNIAFWQKGLKMIDVDIDSILSSAAKFGALPAAGLVGIQIFKKIAEFAMMSNARVVNISKNLNVSREEAGKLAGYFKSASNIMDNIDTTTEDIIKAQLSLNEALGTNVVFSKENLKTLSNLQEVLGLSTQETKTLTQYSTFASKSFEDIQNSIYGVSTVMQLNNKTALDHNKILKTVLNTTGTIRANFRGSLEELTKGVTKAMLLGTTLENVDKTASSLLNFEESISSQLEAELLTGKSLNLERARTAALTNDTMTLMQEINKQAGDFDKFNKMNRVQQEGWAKAFGMSRGEVSDMLADYKTISALSKVTKYDTQKTLQENFERWRSEGKSIEEINNLLGSNVAAMRIQQDASQKFAKMLTKLQDIISSMFDNVDIQKIALTFGTFVKAVSEKGIWGAIVGNNADIRSELEANLKSKGVDYSSQSSQAMTVPRDYSQTPAQTTQTEQTNKANAEFMKQQNQLLKSIDSKLDRTGNVYMGSQKVGSAMVLQQTKFQ